MTPHSSVSGPGWPYTTDVYVFGSPNVTRPVVVFNDAIASTERPWDPTGPASALGLVWAGFWDAPNGTPAGVGGTWPLLAASPGFSQLLNLTFAVPDPGPDAPASGRRLFLVLTVLRPNSTQPEQAAYIEDRIYVRVQKVGFAVV